MEWKEALADDGSGEVWNREGTIQGIYARKRTDVGPNSSNLYTLKNSKGTEVGVWGSAVLDSRMAQIPIGSEVKIQSLGKTTSEKTGRSYYDYKVLWREVPFTEVSEKPKDTVATEKEVEDDIDLSSIPF